jgi:hypothetical protein
MEAHIVIAPPVTSDRRICCSDIFRKNLKFFSGEDSEVLGEVYRKVVDVENFNGSYFLGLFY